MAVRGQTIVDISLKYRIFYSVQWVLPRWVELRARVMYPAMGTSPISTAQVSRCLAISVFLKAALGCYCFDQFWTGVLPSASATGSPQIFMFCEIILRKPGILTTRLCWELRLSVLHYFIMFIFCEQWHVYVYGQFTMINCLVHVHMQYILFQGK